MAGLPLEAAAPGSPQSQVRSDFEALLADTEKLKSTGQALYQHCAQGGQLQNPVPLVIGSLLARVAFLGAAVHGPSLEAAWSPERRQRVLADMAGDDAETIFCSKLLPEAIKSVVAALDQADGEKSSEQNEQPEWLVSWIADDGLEKLDPATIDTPKAAATEAPELESAADEPRSAGHATELEHAVAPDRTQLPDAFAPIQTESIPRDHVDEHTATQQPSASTDDQTRSTPPAIQREKPPHLGGYDGEISATVNDQVRSTSPASRRTRQQSGGTLAEMPIGAAAPAPSILQSVHTVKGSIRPGSPKISGTLSGTLGPKLALAAKSSKTPSRSLAPSLVSARAQSQLLTKELAVLDAEARLLVGRQDGRILLECLQCLLAEDFHTAPKLWKAVAVQSKDRTTIGLHELDEALQLNLKIVLPKETMLSIWRAAVDPEGTNFLFDKCPEKLQQVRMNYHQFMGTFMPSSWAEMRKKQENEEPIAVAYQQPSCTAAFKSRMRTFNEDQHRRRPSSSRRASKTKATVTKSEETRQREERGFFGFLTAEAQARDEGSFRMAMHLALCSEFKKKLRHCFLYRDWCHQKMVEELEEDFLHDHKVEEMAQEAELKQENIQRHSEASQTKLAELSQEWHVIKSFQGPVCVFVEYPYDEWGAEERWKEDIKVEEWPVKKVVHQLREDIDKRKTPTFSEESFTELVVTYVREGSFAEHLGVIPGARLVSIGMQSHRFDPQEGTWIDEKTSTLAFEVPNEEGLGPVQDLVRAAAGEHDRHHGDLEIFNAFTQTLRRRCLQVDGHPTHSKVEERRLWEAITASSCAGNLRIVREQLHHALELAWQRGKVLAPLAESSADLLFDLALGSEEICFSPRASQATQPSSRRPGSLPPEALRTTAIAAPSATVPVGTWRPRDKSLASGYGSIGPQLRLECPTCETCGGRGHDRHAPHLLGAPPAVMHVDPQMRRETYGIYCDRRLDAPWTGRCGGRGHLAWQCPGLYSDSAKGIPYLPGRRCRKCLGLLACSTIASAEAEHPAFQDFWARMGPCEICQGLGHWWRTCPHTGDTVQTVDIRQLARIRRSYLAESLRLAGTLDWPASLKS
eukprot:TRINITY_DN58273_c0_g1_i1.p1 TRINITY_DN58273_c0_g1~~TRINITY_DN58273_c0_g1_i1.p1  ORF type:complete len:1102 (-),score=189.15 TRINITY_DN58273_c0_g1_i1:335-3601(-)